MALSTTKTKRPLSFTILGVGFAVIGAFTLLNIAAALVQFHVVREWAVAYAGMDFLIAYGFITRQRWLAWVTALNCASVVVIAAITLSLGTITTAAPLIIGVLVNISVLYYVWEKRRLLAPHPHEYAAGGLFILLWLYAFTYTMYILLR